MIKRIINHWTGGTYKITDLDKKHYHVIIGGDGQWQKGNFTVESNLNTADGEYAAHTLNCNEGSIGISVACMAGAVQNKSVGSYPLKEIQWDEMIQQNARFCIKYGIPVTPQTVLTHAEVQKNLKIRQRGKWDIAILPFDDSIEANATAVGNELRRRVSLAIAAQEKTAKNKDALTITPKPVLKTKGVQATMMGFLGGGGAASIATLQGFDWMSLAILIGAAVLVGGFFWWRYREQIEAGLFGPKET